MKTPKQPFRFKHFKVSHHRSAMKVGVDGTLIGTWADIEGANQILDVGTGCGLIALIMAQRCQGAMVTGIDIDESSVMEARENAEASPWRDRIEIRKITYDEYCHECMEKGIRFDLVVSNPPYFDSGITDANTPREIARHQGTLSPKSLLKSARNILSDNGSVAMVIPADESENVEQMAEECGYSPTRQCFVRGHEKAPWKRVLLQWQYKSTREASKPNADYLTLETAPGTPTKEYRTLCKDFYLKF